MRIFLPFFVMVMLAVQLVSAGNIVTTDINKLPISAKEVLLKHFPNAKVSHIEIDKDALQSPSYDVLLDNGTKIEFNSKGQWAEVDCKKTEVPASIIPANIHNYVMNNFKEAKIVKIERDRKVTEVKLSNGMELKFDSKGRFLKTDM